MDADTGSAAAAAATALTACFEAERPRLRQVAFRILGSGHDADDAVQQAWLKASQADLSEVANLTGWLVTVTGRECLDQLRARKRRAEVALPEEGAWPAAGSPSAPETVLAETVLAETVLAESVGRALLVVLDRLTAAERVALVLHDMFAVPFAQVAEVTGRSPDAAKKLASRARRKVRGAPVPASSRDAMQQRLAAAFLAAARGGDLAGLIAVLAPDAVRRAEPPARPPGAPAQIRGAAAVARETVLLRDRAAAADLARIDGAPGIVVAPGGRLRAVLVLTFAGARIAGYEVIADPARLARLSITVPN